MICAKLLNALLSRDEQRGAIGSPELLLDDELLLEVRPLLDVDEELLEDEPEELLPGCPPEQAISNKCVTNKIWRDTNRRMFIGEPS